MHNPAPSSIGLLRYCCDLVFYERGRSFLDTIGMQWEGEVVNCCEKFWKVWKHQQSSSSSSSDDWRQPQAPQHNAFIIIFLVPDETNLLQARIRRGMWLDEAESRALLFLRCLSHWLDTFHSLVPLEDIWVHSLDRLCRRGLTHCWWIWVIRCHTMLNKAALLTSSWMLRGYFEFASILFCYYCAGFNFCKLLRWANCFVANVGRQTTWWMRVCKNTSVLMTIAISLEPWIFVKRICYPKVKISIIASIVTTIKIQNLNTRKRISINHNEWN